MHTVDVDFFFIKLSVSSRTVSLSFFYSEPSIFLYKRHHWCGFRGAALSLDPDGSLGGPQSLGHWVDRHLQFNSWIHGSLLYSTPYLVFASHSLVGWAANCLELEPRFQPRFPAMFFFFFFTGLGLTAVSFVSGCSALLAIKHAVL